MVRKVFFSFYYQEDGWRAAQVRNMGVLEADNPISDNDWEQVKKGGDQGIQKWIDAQMSGKSCCVVLVGANTSTRRWVKYEIKKAWDEKKGLVGIRIHNLLNHERATSVAGQNPFELFSVGQRNLSSIVKLYNPSGTNSAGVYASIKDNIKDWVEEAIAIRNQN